MCITPRYHISLLSTECLSFPHTCNLFGFKQTHLHIICIHNLDACQSVSLIYSMVPLSVDANLLRQRQRKQRKICFVAVSQEILAVHLIA